MGDGEGGLVVSPRGEVRARVRIDAGLPPGLLFMPFHRGPLLEPTGWANALPARALDPVSFQPELKHTVVRLQPASRRIALSGGQLARAVADPPRERCVPGLHDSTPPNAR